MSDQHEPETAEVLQCSRIEVVDDDGQVRIVLGNIAVSDDFEPGIAILDENGSERISIALFAQGPQLSIAADGTGVIDLFVSDRGPETGIGSANLVVADGTGRPVVHHAVPLHTGGQWPDPRPRRRPR